MSAHAEDNDRRLIPRWRFADQLSFSPEFAGDPRLRKVRARDRTYLDLKLADWRRDKSIGTAIDLVSCGSGGGWYEEVQPAASYLLDKQADLSPQARALATRALHCERTNGTPNPADQLGLDLTPDTFSLARAKVSAARQRLQRDPGNPLAWLDLSRGHSILGNLDKARFAMERALYLAPNHRHTLRAAARFYIHSGDFERAHTLLLRAPPSKSDPWLMAAEISAAGLADRKPRLAREGRRLVESGTLPPEHLTELQGALGTLEFVSGAERRAKKDLRSSLEAPTDNAVAQARWLSTKLPGIDISEAAFELPLSYEARCWRALQEGRWQDARGECLSWLYDEPFSSQPAQVGSYIGVSMTSDPEFAEASAKAGLTADPRDASLRNNLAIALAYQGKTIEAIAEFRKIELPLPSNYPAYVYLATTGLLRFRAGDIEGGRKMYEKAQGWAPPNRRGRVAIFRAREELHADTESALSHVERARQMNAKATDDDAKRLLELLEEQAGAHRIQKAVDSALETESMRQELTPLIKSSDQVLPDGNLATDISSHPHSLRTHTMAGKKDSHPGHRSSVTGRFVKEGYAKRYPHRTQKESIPNPGHGDTGRGKKGK